MSLTLNINGREQRVDVEEDTPLLWVLRDVVGLTGTKFGCGIAMCGACTVHVDGVARRSCVTPVGTVKAAKIETIEALDRSAIGKSLQKAWLDIDVPQCGYCQSGQLMSAASLLASNSAPSDAEIDAVMSGNICRCGTYGRVRAAIHRASANLADSSGEVVK